MMMMTKRRKGRNCTSLYFSQKTEKWEMLNKRNEYALVTPTEFQLLACPFLVANENVSPVCTQIAAHGFDGRRLKHGTGRGWKWNTGINLPLPLLTWLGCIKTIFTTESVESCLPILPSLPRLKGLFSHTCQWSVSTECLHRRPDRPTWRHVCIISLFSAHGKSGLCAEA